MLRAACCLRSSTCIDSAVDLDFFSRVCVCVFLYFALFNCSAFAALIAVMCYAAAAVFIVVVFGVCVCASLLFQSLV